MYKVSFTDINNQDFLGTANHFTTDGRYSLNTVDQIAHKTASKLLDRNKITGYVIRRGRFISPIIASVKL